MSNTIYGQPITMGGGGGDGLNIAYGTTPPDDTSKLWVPLTTKPTNVEVSCDSLQSAVDTVEVASATLTNTAYNFPSVEIAGKIYVFSTGTKPVQIYDTKTGELTLGVNVSNVSMVNASAAAINGKAYIFYSGSSYTIHEYDPATDTYTQKDGRFSTSCSRSSAVAINGKAYIFGGYPKSSVAQDTIYEYDPATDTCTKKSSVLITGLQQTCAVAINEKAYIFGGATSATTSVSHIQEYDPATETLTEKDVALPQPVRGACAVAIYGKAYIFGGSSSASAHQDTIQEYDPVANTCILKNTVLKQTITGACSQAVDGVAYILGTGSAAGDDSMIQKYTPKTYLAANYLKIFASVYETNTEQVVTNIVNGNSAQVKLHMTSAFIGDDDGYAKAQDAYVYDTVNSEWQALDGTSMTTDMLNALAELGVT